MVQRTNKKILLTSRPAGMPALDNLKIVDAEMTEPKEGEVLIRIREAVG
jgi:NADPH-dependent curcumin reductase CurA